MMTTQIEVKRKIVAFHTPNLNIRGTCVAIYDYAYYNETLLGNQSVIVIPRNPEDKHDLEIFLKFRKRFQIFIYDNEKEGDFENVVKICDVLYCIKYGLNDGIVSRAVKTVVHCVFVMSEPHGDVYAGVSSTLAKKFNKDLYVPHMIGLRPSKNKNDNLRKTLKIPNDAIVFGRHGGDDTFDLYFVKVAICRVIHDKENVYFIFVNTPVFYVHPRVIFLQRIIDTDEKNRFICTCDAMIHAQSMGETFGIAIGEFIVNGKPVIAYGGKVKNDNYKYTLGKTGIYYNDEKECYNIMMNFKPVYAPNCFAEFSPENVMRQFEKVFLLV